MRLKIFFLLLITTSFAHQLFAHAMWIETSPTGKTGKQQEVKIYFGEFSDKDITLTEKWFSDIKDFTLIAVAPDKSEIKLSAIADKEFYKAVFTPQQEGVYTLVMHHTVKDVYGTMKLDYNSSATVTVNNQFAGNNAFVNKNIVSLFSTVASTAKQQQLITVKALYNNSVAADQKVKVIAPNGWEKELYSDEKGEVVFKALWPGNYMVELAYTIEEKGEHNGKKYEQVYKMATYLITVK